MATKLKDGLYIGDAETAADLEFMLQAKVTHVVNLAGHQVPNSWEKIGMRYLTFKWENNESYNLFDKEGYVVHDIMAFIEAALFVQESVLINGVEGLSRCVVCAAVYFMVKYGWSVDKTMEFITSRRIDVNPLNSFKRQLSKLSEGVGLDSKRAEKMKELVSDVSRFSLWDPVYLGDNQSPEVEEERILVHSYINSQPVTEECLVQALLLIKDSKSSGKPRKLSWSDNPVESKRIIIKEPKPNLKPLPGILKVNLESGAKEDLDTEMLNLSRDKALINSSKLNSSWMNSTIGGKIVSRNDDIFFKRKDEIINLRHTYHGPSNSKESEKLAVESIYDDFVSLKKKDHSVLTKSKGEDRKPSKGKRKSSLKRGGFIEEILRSEINSLSIDSQDSLFNDKYLGVDSNSLSIAKLLENVKKHSSINLNNNSKPKTSNNPTSIGKFSTDIRTSGFSSRNGPIIPVHGMLTPGLLLKGSELSSSLKPKYSVGTNTPPTVSKIKKEKGSVSSSEAAYAAYGISGFSSSQKSSSLKGNTTKRSSTPQPRSRPSSTDEKIKKRSMEEPNYNKTFLNPKEPPTSNSTRPKTSKIEPSFSSSKTKQFRPKWF